MSYLYDGTRNRRRNRHPVFWIALVTVVVAALLAATVWHVMEPVQYSTGQRITPVSPSPSAEVPSPTTSSVTAPAPPPLPQDFVVQSMPTSFVVTRDGEPLIQPQPVIRMQRVPVGANFILEIPGDTVALIDDPGVDWAGLPGSVAEKTVHILGHTNREPPMVFNPLAMHDPMTDDALYRAEITLPSGVVTYDYVQTQPVAKGALWGKLQELSGHPGRVLVVMCRLEMRNGVLLNTDEALIWEFQYMSSLNTG